MKTSSSTVKYFETKTRTPALLSSDRLVLLSNVCDKILGRYQFLNSGCYLQMVLVPPAELLFTDCLFTDLLFAVAFVLVDTGRGSEHFDLHSNGFFRLNRLKRMAALVYGLNSC